MGLVLGSNVQIIYLAVVTLTGSLSLLCEILPVHRNSGMVTISLMRTFTSMVP